VWISTLSCEKNSLVTSNGKLLLENMESGPWTRAGTHSPRPRRQRGVRVATMRPRSNSTDPRANAAGPDLSGRRPMPGSTSQVGTYCRTRRRTARQGHSGSCCEPQLDVRRRTPELHSGVTPRATSYPSPDGVRPENERSGPANRTASITSNRQRENQCPPQPRLRFVTSCRPCHPYRPCHLACHRRRHRQPASSPACRLRGIRW
jgi:hypothetical protein